MLPASLTMNQLGWLLTLLALWAALLLGGFTFGRLSVDRQRRMPAWTRMASTAILVCAGWSWFAFSRGQPRALPPLIAIGITLGWLGDLFLAHWLPARQPVLAGMAAFGLGHVAYIAALLRFGSQAGLAAGLRWGAWLAWLLIGSVAWYLVVFRSKRRTALHLAALPYALLLAGTAGVATGLASQAPALVPLAVGAGLFLASDLLLAARLFNGVCFYLSDDLVWLLYGPAQMLIVYTAGIALTRI